MTDLLRQPHSTQTRFLMCTFDVRGCFVKQILSPYRLMLNLFLATERT